MAETAGYSPTSPSSPMQEEAPRGIAELVARYRGLDERAIKKYTEADTRRVFILPLFKALGWDVSSREEVTEEERVSRGRVDYAFRLRGIPEFFLEAKALKADFDNPEYAKQAINYAYHKGVTWAVLTNFEGLKVFNAEVKEAKVFQALFFELRWDEYLSHLDQLWLLSRDAFQQGLLDKEALKWAKKIRKTPVGQQLLSDLVQWRDLLHKYLSLYNKDKPNHLIDEAVQRILDRLIFIRTCEDRGIEPPTLRPLIREWRNGAHKDFIKELKRVWRDFNEGYDSRLFLTHLADELDCEPTPFAKAIEGLYATEDRSIEYDFNAIDADVLGGIYEQYLQHLLKRAGEEVEIAAERRKRKAQGIYYTPKFVVRYIVENTLGRALEGKSLSEARKIRILDPACGSGSFLVEALDYLERHWQRQKWTPQPKAGEDAQQADFFDYLTRVQFLNENLYGVDLDAQAVEIAQLNLLLKSLNQRALLPDLVNNIRQGNSLISGTKEDLRPYFGDAWQEKKPFNWEEQFAKIMEDGGFDIVIGNPPYVRPHKLAASDKQALWAQYQVYRAKSDIYACFIQRAIDLLKPGGYASYIVSNTFMSLESFAPLRRYILDTCCILYLGLTPKKVFEAATVETIVLGLKKESNEDARRQNKVLITEYRDGTFESFKEIHQAIFYSTYLNIFDLSWDEATLSLSNKIELNTDKLSEVVAFCYGLKTGDDTVFLAYAPATPEHKRLLRRSDFERFSTKYKGEFVWYVPEQMRKHRTTARPGSRERFEKPKILVQDIGKRLVATLDNEHFYVKDALILYQRESGLDLRFVLALINSRLLNYWYVQKFSTLSVAKNAILTLPIRRIDFDNPAEKKLHDDLVTLVEKMLDLNKRLAPIRTTPCNEQDELLREIERTDDEIDNLVYDLYGLTEGDRQVVGEGG
ncbi:MAG: Type IIS restriction enzyme Eco57I [Syntrophomonadaceae bacterium]|nr:Type IIS restriction enzyme Eco57I [Bacillota bacterium]